MGMLIGIIMTFIDSLKEESGKSKDKTSNYYQDAIDYVKYQDYENTEKSA